MLYRIRRYTAVPENAAAFHDFFNRHLLPVQQRHGARLVGRWATDDEFSTLAQRKTSNYEQWLSDIQWTLLNKLDFIFVY